jgi:hypothetical protein
MEVCGSYTHRTHSGRVVGLDAGCRRHRWRSCSHEGLNATLLHEESVLIENSTLPCDDPAPSVGVGFKRVDRRDRVYRVTEGNWTKESPLKNRQERHGIDSCRLADKSGRNRHSKQSMCHRPAERPALAGSMVDVQWVKVPGKSGEQDDIGFGDRSARSHPFVADYKIIKCPN